MKKLTKFVLIFGGGLFFGGLLLALTCLALGSDTYLLRQRLDQIDFIHIGTGWETPAEWELADRKWDASLPEQSRLPELAESAPAGEYGIKDLDFNFDLGDVRIIWGEDFELIYGSENTRRLYSERKVGDEWRIVTNKVRWRWFGSWPFRQNDIRLTVVLPNDFVPQSVSISMGAGNLQIESLRAQKLLLEVGLGNCRLGNLNAEEISLNVGVGNLEAREFRANKAQLEVGMGNMELCLAHPLDQFRCHVKVGLGNVKLGSQNYSSVADANSGFADAPYSLDISCGLGSINIMEEVI